MKTNYIIVNDNFFDTLLIKLPDQVTVEELKILAEEKEINLYFPGDDLTDDGRFRPIGSQGFHGVRPFDDFDDNILTLGGYLEVHTRPPAFSGSDEQPYTVSVEIETVEDLAKPFVCYLVFPRWAETGLGIVGHVETPVLWNGRSRDEVRDRAHELPLVEVKRLLDEAVQRKSDRDSTADHTAMPKQ